MPLPTDQAWVSDKRDALTQRLFFALCGLFLIGLFFSRALLSTVPFLMFVLALTRPDFKERFHVLKKNRPAVGLLAVYGLLLISLLYTEDRDNWFQQMYRYSPLFLLPAAGALVPPLRKKQVYGLLYFFILLTTVITIGTMARYISNIQAQNQLIIHSQNPPPLFRLFHIHFGVMMAMAIFYGIYIYYARLIWWRPAEKFIVLVCIVILFISIHVLAYRTGLLALYITLLVKIYGIIKNQKRYLLGGALLLVFITAPIVSYFSLESMQLRVENTRNDVNRYLTGQDINYYSIAQRLAAWETAFSVIKKNWLVGVGPADMKLEMDRQYSVKDFGLIKENQVMIHNQYLHMLMGSGIIGLLIFLYTLIYPFRRLAWQKDFCASSFLLIMCAAMLVDSFFELQRGLSLFVFFYLLLIIRKEQGMLLSKARLKDKFKQPVAVKGN